MAEPAVPPPETCYRHADRKAGVRCQRCERPICPSCMIQASVGFHCPECVKGSKTKIVRVGELASRPIVSQVLIGANLAAFVAALASGGSLGGGGSLIADGGLNGPAVDVLDEYWRIVTSGFLHVGLLHLGFNMFLLYRLGQMLEPRLGSVRFGVLYLTALLCGSFGALLLQPRANTVGASGAVFGLMGVAMIGMRRQGVNPWQTDIGSLLLLNLVFTFALPNISVGGHLGGLAGGALAGWLLLDLGDRVKSAVVPVLACLAVAVAAVPACLWAAAQWADR